MPRKLAEGVYEDLLTTGLAASLDAIAPFCFDVQKIERSDLPSILATHLRGEIERALASSPDADSQVQLADALLATIRAAAPDSIRDDASASPPPRLLTSVYRTIPPRRPSTPLTTSTLLTRNRAEPALGHEIGCEIESADAVDLLAAFITLGGVRAIRAALDRFARRGGKIRILTTVFTGTTEVDAIDALARLPEAEVRISYDVRRTRLHAKAWLFRRNTGLHCAYIGSANVTSTALTSGHEWMVKVCAADLSHVIEKFSGTFEGLWNDAEFEVYDPNDDAHRERLRRALKAERSFGTPEVISLFTLRPFPFQQEILDRLAAERLLHGRYRNLVVAATGTGKTVIAAFDYATQANAAGTFPRLLFLAHRRELLEQARSTFRQILRDASFGELLCDGDVPERWESVFATVQSFARAADRVTPTHFDHVVIDECHHAPADSYQRAIQFLQPRLLIGLTATPERSDGKSLLPDFAGQVAAELRLWHALDKQLLAPFEYYGISDGTDLTDIRWARAGYDAAGLSGVYTGNEARVDLIVEQLRRRVVDVRSVRGLAFCVSVDHAEYMARALTERGVPAVAVHGGTSDLDRSVAPRRLREREVNIVCTCDLYNEGVDLPFVDTLLFLRPTASATLFLQQLGRGLRLEAGKTSCLVLDFIGQHRAEFRFDDLYAALTNVPRGRLVEAVKGEFPYLPSGCVLELDAVARGRILESLKRALPTTERLARELREAAAGDRAMTLAQFLAATGREAEDVYRGDNGWTTLRVRAGLAPAVSEDEADLSRRLQRLLHVDEPARLASWTTVFAPNAENDTDLYRRRITMLDLQLHDRGVIRDSAETTRYLGGFPELRTELRDLAEVLKARVNLPSEHLPVADWPLAIHHHYSRREIQAAIGFVRPGQKAKTVQAGILKLEDQKREILFVTLDKSGSSFSPSTRYRDYAISPSLFHWETQSNASVSRPSGLRYIESSENGWSFYLFVRERPDSEAQYAFLGQARLHSFSGDRPIAITWELLEEMPAGLFEKFATLAQG